MGRKGRDNRTMHGNEQFPQDNLAKVKGDRAPHNAEKKDGELFAVVHREALPAKTRRVKNAKEAGGWLGHTPIMGDLDLGGVCAEKLHVWVTVLEQEAHDEVPGLPLALQLEQFALQARLVVRR